jgi:hypothetical protein
MSKLSKLAQERLELLNGCEVWSINYEQCVMVKRDKVIGEGKVIATLNTSKKVNELWEEYLEGEGIGYY